MGWTSFTKNKSIKEEILDYYKDSKFKIVDISCQGRESYVATHNTQTGEIFAEVILSEVKDGEIYLKDMAETCMPYYYNCPKRIIDKLTKPCNDKAAEWRQKCLSKPKTPKYGDKIKLAFPLKFTDGFQRDEFIVVKYGKAGKRYRCVNTGIEVKITNLKDREFSII